MVNLSATTCHETDVSVVDALRGDTSLGIAELARHLGVTATAVRQRLERLMRAGLVERRVVSRPRGRPAHSYRLTEAGRKLGGDNFRDLAMVLWKEIRGIADDTVRRGLLNRVAGALAETYRGQVTGGTARERLEEVAGIFDARQVACSVDGGALPVLTTYSCPYPELAETDRAICAAERLMIQDLVGVAVQLSECRLDGASCCRFTAAPEPLAGHADAALDPRPVAESNAARFLVHPPVSERMP
ncbi:MAG: helix-turn-helix transcriptional regulator [Planctomycetaceae bacterium]